MTGSSFRAMSHDTTLNSSLGRAPVDLTLTTVEQKRNTFNGFEEFYLKAKAKIWPLTVVYAPFSLHTGRQSLIPAR